MAVISHDSANNPFPNGLPIKGFRKLNKYIYDLIEALMKDQELLKLLKYNSRNPLNEKDIDLDKEKIMYKYIYPFKKDITTTKETKSSVRIYFKGSLREGDILKNNSLSIDVLVPSDIMSIRQGTREIEIMDRIDKILNGARGMGLGQVEFKAFWQIESQDVSGYSMIYEVRTLN